MVADVGRQLVVVLDKSGKRRGFGLKKKKESEVSCCCNLSILA